jgi:hypothetical protein
MKKIKSCPAKIIVLTLILFVGLIIKINPSFAQQAHQVTLTAIPPRAGTDELLKGKPGEKIQTKIRVRNNSDETISLESIIKDYIVKDDGVTPIPVEEDVSNRWSLAAWMVVTPNQHNLAPRETAQISVLIEIPDDALPGGHYAMVLHRPASLVAAEDQQSASAINQQVGTLFYVIVDGPINEEAFIRNFTFKKFQEFGPIPFSFKVDSQADIHISPTFKIDIFNMFGKQIDSFSLESQNIFPYTTRSFDGLWRQQWGFGLYKAQITMSFGQAGNLGIASSQFWILPITLIITVLIIILVIIAMTIAIRRHLKHKQQAQQVEIQQLQEKVDQLEEENGQKKT